MKTVIIDMQPITPAIGGGRQRLLGLYHALGADIEAVYVGSYDWPGEPHRDQSLSAGLRERLVPLSEAHHAAARELAAGLDGRVVIDLAFADQARLSPEFLDEARRQILDARIVVFSHPWAYQPLRDAIRPGQLVVYDSQNVEAVLRASLHDDLPAAAGLLRRVAEVEYQLCREADLVLACSHEDREMFARIYDVDWTRLRVVPNGIFAFGAGDAPASPPPSRDEQTVVFVGSDYGPNNDAARFVVDSLAPHLPSVTFALIGSCCNALGGRTLPDNVRALGVLEEDAKRDWLRRATVAVNPLAAGSGTSIKMFDFMAAGLPSLTTAVGGRGINTAGGEAFALASLEHFAAVLADLLKDPARRQAIADAGRRTVEAFYAWERISPSLGRLFRKRLAEKARGTRTFSVVIPTYERHALLDRLMGKLEEQSLHDFEVIVVDQSAQPWPAAALERSFPLTYVHSEVRGAVKARNLGGHLASGQVIAFTDDDCEPRPNWLLHAEAYFKDPSVAGVEGLVCSDKLDDPDWRPVTNIGFEGIGFMTANLMVRNKVFQQLGGFDLDFDDPHFREDTDFGWRLQEIGRVPYARDVEVYHPPHRRDVARESQAVRNRFFEKDALLMCKHPERYRNLFLAEAHYANTAGFWQHFERGLRKYGVSFPEWMADYR